MVKFSPGNDYSTNKTRRVRGDSIASPMMAAVSAAEGDGGGEAASLGVGMDMAKGILASIDLETLDCNICMEPLSPPVFQCANGHIACSHCCESLCDKCHSCAQPIGKIRCLAIEKVIESVKVYCKYACNGCKELVRYSQRPDHESQCMYAPYLCPVSGCSFSCPSQQFSNHFTSVHRASLVEFNYDAWFTVILDTDEQFCILESEDMVFLLHNKMIRLGNLVHIICFGPASMEEHYSYKIEIKKGRRRLTTENFPKSIAGIRGIPHDSLLVPIETYEENGCLTFEISFHHL